MPPGLWLTSVSRGSLPLQAVFVPASPWLAEDASKIHLACFRYFTQGEWKGCLHFTAFLN